MKLVTNLALTESFDQRIDKNLFFQSDSAWLCVSKQPEFPMWGFSHSP